MVGKRRMGEVTERLLEGTEVLWRKERGKKQKKNTTVLILHLSNAYYNE